MSFCCYTYAIMKIPKGCKHVMSTVEYSKKTAITFVAFLLSYFTFDEAFLCDRLSLRANFVPVWYMYVYKFYLNIDHIKINFTNLNFLNISSIISSVMMLVTSRNVNFQEIMNLS